MSNLKFHQVTITPEDHKHLHNVLSYVRGTLGRKKQESLDKGEDSPLSYWEEQVLKQSEDLEKWKDYVSQSLYQCWRDLPDGDHLKNSYSESVWTWDDQDLHNIPPENQVSPEEARKMLESLEVED